MDFLAILSITLATSACRELKTLLHGITTEHIKKHKAALLYVSPAAIIPNAKLIVETKKVFLTDSCLTCFSPLIFLSCFCFLLSLPIKPEKNEISIGTYRSEFETLPDP